MKNKASTNIFIASIFVGILIAVNFKIDSVSGMINVNQYDQLYNKRLKMYSDLNVLKQRYDQLQQKVNKYERIKDNNYDMSKELEKELEKMRIKLQLTGVEGKGLRITLRDSDFNGKEVYTDYQVIHDDDIRMMINDLKNAGAEAIAINGERVVYDTYTYCSGVSINVGGTDVVTPFYIEVIGDGELMENYLRTNKSQYKKLLFRDINVVIEKVDKLTIKGYTGDIKFQHMKNSER